MKICLTLFTSILVLICFSFSMSGLSTLSNKQEVGWPFKEIDVFFKDSSNNFEKLKRVKNIQDKMSAYLRYNRDSIENFFEGSCQQLDENKMEMVMFLLSVYPYDLIADWGARIFGSFPELFIKKLEKYDNWRSIMAGISERWEEIFPALARLGESKFENDIKEFAASLYQKRESLYQKRQEGLAIISAFIKDPIQYFDKLKTIGDIGIWVERFDRDKNNGIYPRSAIDYLFQQHFQQIDEKKVEILFYMLLNCFDGSYAESIGETVARTFYYQTGMFVTVLKNIDRWKEIIDSIIDLEWETVMKATSKLGESDFEKELRNFILSYKKQD